MSALLASHNARILVVEDDNDYLQRILSRLQKNGYTAPDTARNEEEARHCLEQNHYDVIIADMRLGSDNAGGFAVVDEVKLRNITSVIIVLSANDTVADCRKALRGGRCWDYISKTMEEGSALEELHRSMQEALTWLNRWGNRQDEAWIQDNLDSLREKYPEQFVAVINNTVIESAATAEKLKQHLEERRLPLFLPVIRKIETALPHCVPVAELVRREVDKPDEGRHLEFKSTLLWNIRGERADNKMRFAVLKTIAAFLNTEGGTLLIGVEDDGNIYGIEQDFPHVQKKPERQNRDGFEGHLWDAIKSQIGIPFAQYIKLRFELQEGGKTVCAADVLKAPEPAFLISLKDRNLKEFYIRPGNQTEALDMEQMYKYLRMKKWF
ncbi:MAG: response regulator [Gammaproteobacteria bacterium]|nr:response regulator [Gammaproteobacteria bacterium]